MTDTDEHQQLEPCCLCNQKKMPQIKLRGLVEDVPCSHVSCVQCIMGHLHKEIEQHTRGHSIPCVDPSCVNFMHPNDIRLVLLHPELDEIESQEDRAQLLDYYERLTVITALGGPDAVKECPACQELYGRAIGCNYVRCANRKCRQQFCWTCGNKVDTVRHFVKNKTGCNLSWDDLNKGSFPIKFLGDTNPCCLCLMCPYLFLPAYVLVPLYLCYRFCWHWSKAVRNCLGSRVDKIIVWVLMAVVFVLTLPFGLILCLFSIPLVHVVAVMFFFMFNPCIACIVPEVEMIMCGLQMVSCALGLVGNRDMVMAIEQANDAKQRQQIEEQQEREQQVELSRYEVPGTKKFPERKESSSESDSDDE